MSKLLRSNKFMLIVIAIGVANLIAMSYIVTEGNLATMGMLWLAIIVAFALLIPTMQSVIWVMCRIVDWGAKEGREK